MIDLLELAGVMSAVLLVGAAVLNFLDREMRPRDRYLSSVLDLAFGLVMMALVLR